MSENKAYLPSSDDVNGISDTQCEDERGFSKQEVKPNSQHEFIVYKIRWGVLLTVALLNISNASLWINFFPATTTVANYFDRTAEQINWFSLTFLILAIPGAFLVTFFVDKWGLKYTIWVGCCLNTLGAAIRAIGTSGLFPDIDTQFAVSLVGQIFCATAQNFIIYLHTKVSQTWFSDHQRGIATTILSMSNPLGIVIAEVTVPYIVSSEDKIPLNDKIWFGVSLLSVVATILFVRRAVPKTPPSYSAIASNEERPSYLQQLKIAFTTVPFIILLFSLGSGIALVTSLATVTQQILCPLGYSEAFGGIINGLMLLCGFVGALFAGILLDRTKMYTEITMYLFGSATLISICLFEFLLVPNKEVLISIFAALFGFFGVALFPVGLELAVETTFPVEETITTAFIFVSGELQAIIIIAIIPLLSREMSDTTLSVCGLESEDTPKDYTVSLLVVMTMLGLIASASIFFFKTEYKRQNAGKLRAENADESTPEC